MSDLSHYIKVSSSPSGCDSYNAEQFKCDRYLDCESCIEDKIIEHDKQIIAKTIDDCLNILKNHKHNWGVIEWVIKDIEKLKEQNK